MLVNTIVTCATNFLSNKMSFNQLLIQESLQVAVDLLAYFSHWITPEVAPRRFDTRFFLAAMPADQVALADTDETTDEHWITPQQALRHHAAGAWQMIDPTLRSLETLSQYKSVAAALAGVRAGNHLMPLTPELNRQGMQALG